MVFWILIDLEPSMMSAEIKFGRKSKFTDFGGYTVHHRFSLSSVIFFVAVSIAVFGCAPVEYSVVIVSASDAIDKAEEAGASCTEQQLAERSPVTRYNALQSGTEVASTEPADAASAESVGCGAPFEYYSAIEYLAKAREEVGYSDYQAALEYARQAREYARRARELSLLAGREGGQ